jgi:hemin uptake protein HemP
MRRLSGFEEPRVTFGLTRGFGFRSESSTLATKRQDTLRVPRIVKIMNAETNGHIDAGDARKTATPDEVVLRLPSTMPPTYRYLDLSRSGSEVLIEFEGQIYRLKMTRNGKLTLNK